MDELFGVTTWAENKTTNAERAASEGLSVSEEGNGKVDHKTTETRMESA